jgi:DNA-directed RNA polymerase specialized sigma24 family protein
VRKAVISAVAPTPPVVHDLNDFYSVAEISQMLDALTEPDWRRLLRSSHYLAQGHRILAADLRQEAFVRSLDGRRRCRRSFNIVNFLIGIMRSLTSQEREADRDGTREVGIDMLQMASISPSPEQVGHDALHYRRTIAAVFETIGSDSKLVELLNAVLDGVKGADLRTRSKVDAKGLASLRRQLRRKLASAAANRSVP